MTPNEIGHLRPQLKEFLRQFSKCFLSFGTRGHLPVYVEGLMSDLQRKSVEPIALNAGVAVRTLQEFLSILKWDHHLARDRLEQIVARNHASSHAIGVIDDTSQPKKGDKTPGVQRQWCGRLGKVENCVDTVHLGYSADAFHCLLDGELYLPESWSQDRKRCLEAGVPDTMFYRPKWKIALELLDRAVGNGIHFGWLTFDEAYGDKPEFLQELERRGLTYIGEIPKNTRGWTFEMPSVTERPYRRPSGRRRKVPRLGVNAPSLKTVEQHLKNTLQDEPWQPYYVKDTQKGPLVWEIKHCDFYPVQNDGLPAEPHHLLIARNAMNPGEIKYFISNAPLSTPAEVLLLVGFSRWSIERCFEDEKTELGFDHYEGRTYVGLIRHQLLAAIAHLFLSEQRLRLGEKKSRTDRPASSHGHGQPHSVLLTA